MPDYEDDEQLWRTLYRNRDKNFVRRVLNPKKSPKLEVANKPGTFMTHLMGSAEIGESYTPIAFPSVVEKRKGFLEQLPDKEVIPYALSTGEFIKFKDRAASEKFATKYKRVWPYGTKK